MKVADRTRLRREYLRQKAGAYSLIALLCIAAVPVFWYGLQKTKIALDYSGMPTCTVILGAVLLGEALLWFVVHTANNVGRKARLVPYVPPVTPDTLPADEILVRGAEQPPVKPSAVLLRAAQGDTTPPEELLRVTDHAE